MRAIKLGMKCLCEVCTAPSVIQNESDEKRLALSSAFTELSRSLPNAKFKIIKLLKEERFILAALPLDVTLKMMRGSSGFVPDYSSVFAMGSEIFLHGLSTRVDLNCRKGIIIKGWDAISGKCGVRLYAEHTSPSEIIAVKPMNMNICKT